jgi:hypothetical protein
MKALNRFYVYIYVDVDNLPVYVGKGTGRRLYDHIRFAKKSKKRSHFLNWIRKYIRETNTNPEVIIYKDKMTQDEALELENNLINAIGRKDKKEGKLLNQTDGGDGGRGRIITDKEREWRREFSKTLWNDERRKSFSESQKGKIISEETRQKLSKASAGKKLSEETKNKISIALTGLMCGEKNSMFGKKHNDETKKLIGYKSKQNWESEDFRNNMSSRKGENNSNSKYVYNIIMNKVLFENIYDLKDFFKDNSYKYKYQSIKILFSNNKTDSIKYKDIIIFRKRYKERENV